MVIGMKEQTIQSQRICLQGLRKNYIFFIWVLFFFSTAYFCGKPGYILQNTILNFLQPVAIVGAYLLFIQNTVFEAKIIILAFLSSIVVVLSYMLNGGGLGSVFYNLNAIVFMVVFSEIQFRDSERMYFRKLILGFHLY